MLLVLLVAPIALVNGAIAAKKTDPSDPGEERLSALPLLSHASSCKSYTARSLKVLPWSRASTHTKQNWMIACGVTADFLHAAIQDATPSFYFRSLAVFPVLNADKLC